MGVLIFYAVISIFFSFLCSILEAVLLSVTPTFISVKKKERKAYATVLEELKNDVDQPLIAILTLNTVAHTVGAILVGVQAKVVYGELYGTTERTIFGIPFTEDLMVGVVSTVMTILILVVSEIIPKTIGATYWRALANFTAKTLRIMVLVLKYTGLLWLLQLFTKMVGGKGHHGSVLSREDFTAMTDIAHEEGVFEKSESMIIKNLLRFDRVLVKDVMTPRAVMKITSGTKTIRAFFEDNPKMRFSRIPVYSEKVDNINGFVLKDNILEEMVNDNGDIPLTEIKRDILITERNTPIPQLFDVFINKREHIALVVDEYGSVSGLVTMEDVIETLLGLEIMDESDNVADLQDLARKNWENRAKKRGFLKKTKNDLLEEAFIQTPLGIAKLQGNSKGLSTITVFDSNEQPSTIIPDNLAVAAHQLKEYFEGTRKNFTLDLNPQGTDFQQRVWKALMEIPYGKTVSYLDLSKTLGDVKAIRAVASANGKNPLWIIVPCHRVIGSDGSLTGYAGGLHRKKWLLEHENPVKQQRLF